MHQFLVGEPSVAVDILGPLLLTEKGNKYVLVIYDCFSKWTEAFSTPDQESCAVSNIIVNEFICRFGTPLQLHSDQGRSFEFNLRDMLSMLRIEKTRTSSQRPQANGAVERFNRTLVNMLSIYCGKKQRHWDKVLPQVMMAYRSSAYSSTGVSPNMMMLGRDITMPIETVIPRPGQGSRVTIKYQFLLIMFTLCRRT